LGVGVGEVRDAVRGGMGEWWKGCDVVGVRRMEEGVVAAGIVQFVDTIMAETDRWVRER